MARGIEIHNGKVKIPYAVQRLHMEIEGGVNIDYFHRLKVTSTSAMALVDKIMSGLVVEAAATEGTITGGTSVFSALHAYLELTISVPCSAFLVCQPHVGTDKTIDFGIDFILGGKTVNKLINLQDGSLINYLMSLCAVSNVINSAETGTAGAKKGYLKVDIGGADRYIRLYDAGN